MCVTRSIACAVCLLFIGGLATSPAEERLRVIISTDAGGDPDDQASFVRFLHYANEWDIEGIIAEDNSTTNWPLTNETTGLGLLGLYLDAYDQVDENLRIHAADYPTADALRAVLTGGGWKDSDGDGLCDGAELILAAAAKDDPRPLWLVEWGSYPGHTIAIVQAVRHIIATTTGAERATLLGKLHFSTLSERDINKTIGPEARQDPGPQAAFGIYVGTGRPPWSRSANDWDVNDDLKRDHGPLGAIYTGTKEGDTNGFVNLIPTGLNDPLQPEWGSWAGRFKRVFADPTDLDNYYWNQFTPAAGELSAGASGKRWENHIANDFAARADWAVATTFAAGNHAPVPVLNGDATRDVLVIPVVAGSVLVLDASATTDPDGDALAWSWHLEADPSSFDGSLDLEGAEAPICRVNVPPEAAGETIHLLLHVQDDDSHRAGLVGTAPWLRQLVPLSRYRRVVIEAQTGVDGNTGPAVSAGPDRHWQEGEPTLTLQGSVADDGKPGGGLVVGWSVISGPGTVTFGSADSAVTSATFSQQGDYLLRLTASDGSVTNSDGIRVGVHAAGTFRPADDPGDVVPGLDRAYFEAEDIDFGSTPKWRDQSTNFLLEPRDRDDHFGFRFTGFLAVPQRGLYPLRTRADDVSRWYIGSDLVAADNVDGGEGLAALDAGLHAITVDFEENRGGERLAIEWRVPGAPWLLFAADSSVVPVPDEALFRPVAGDGQPPTITLAPRIDPDPVTGTSANLQVSASDPDGDDAAIVYHWRSTAKPTGAPDPTIQPNDQPAADQSSITFDQAGSYTLQVIVTDQDGRTDEASLTVTVQQTPAEIRVTP